VSRKLIKSWKRACLAATNESSNSELKQQAKTAAQSLLNRSVKCGHDRLVLIRLSMAVKVDAEISSAQWSYCEALANQSNDPTLQAMWKAVVQLKSIAVAP